MSIRAAIRHTTLPFFVITTVLVSATVEVAADTVSQHKVWIYFTDRGLSPAELAAAVENAPLSARALERRRMRGAGPVRDVRDVPVCAAYVDRLEAMGCVVKRESKYLNAVSALVTPRQVAAIRALPFVREVTPVRRFRRRPPDERFDRFSRPPAESAGEEDQAGSSAALLDYGASFNQLNMINVIPLHDAGNHGEGVMVGVFDTGFNLRHEAFQHLDVEAQWDFIFNDSIVENDPDDLSPSQHSHGTQVLSSLAGFKEGTLIGPAYGATFVLAKTERMFEEVVAEEDDFVRALEWVDSIGVDIVSSSLGYYDFDGTADDYTFADMDGNTAVTTVACDIAAAKGITICTAAGNQRGGSWNHIIAPSDGDSVIAVGAVDADGLLAYFSSPGPTADGRIKPDVAARGINVVTVIPDDSLGYTTQSGTSLSTPLVAGACALILKMHPDWGPMDVLQALRTEASQSDAPDNDLGWGIIDAYQSALGGASGVADALSLEVKLTGADVSGSIFNGNSTTLTVDVVRRKWRQDGNGYESTETVAHSVEVAGSSYSYFADRLSEGGVYEYVVRLTDDPLIQTGATRVTFGFGVTLGQSAPNPFVAGSGTQSTIKFSIGGTPPAPGMEPPISSYAEVTLEVFDVRGARVATLVDEIKSPGEYTISWDGLGDGGNPVASGVYFYRLRVPGQALTRKLVLIRR
jgi:serine protease AprX